MRLQFFLSSGEQLCPKLRHARGNNSVSKVSNFSQVLLNIIIAACDLIKIMHSSKVRNMRDFHENL